MIEVKNEELSINPKDAKNVKHAFNWIIGEYYNCIQDGNIEDIPDSLEDIINYIYKESVTSEYDVGFSGSRQTRTRFSGKEAIVAYIKKLIKEDGDMQEIAELKGWDLSQL